MYLVFIGTTDYLEVLKSYLASVDHTLLQGTAAWMGAPLDAQVVILFDEAQALALRSFLVLYCKQKSVPIHHIQTTQI